jgi:hypothetical protein
MICEHTGNGDNLVVEGGAPNIAADPLDRDDGGVFRISLLFPFPLVSGPW